MWLCMEMILIYSAFLQFSLQQYVMFEKPMSSMSECVVRGSVACKEK